MEIRSVGYLEYFIAFAGCRTPLSDFYVSTAGRNIKILGAWDKEDKESGFLLYEQQGSSAEILCLECTGSKKAAEKYLLLELLELGRKDGFKYILFRLAEGHERYLVLKKLAEESGFVAAKKMYLFRADMKDYSYWKDYRKRHGEALLRFLETEGFQALPFSEASKEILEEVMRDTEASFDEMLGPAGIIQGKKGRFCQDISYLSIKDDHPAAYCLVTNPGKEQYVFEIISAADRYQNTGVIFQSFCLAMDALEDSTCRRIAFAMDQENKKALGLTKRIMKMLICHMDVQYHYEYHYR